LKKISILVENKALREKIGAAGRKKAENLYSYQVNAPKLINIIEHVKNG